MEESGTEEADEEEEVEEEDNVEESGKAYRRTCSSTKVTGSSPSFRSIVLAQRSV